MVLLEIIMEAVLNDSEEVDGQGNWTKFGGNATGIWDFNQDYFVPTWIIAVYVFFLSVGVCVNVGLALILLCSRKNGNNCFFLKTHFQIFIIPKKHSFFGIVYHFAIN